MYEELSESGSVVLRQTTRQQTCTYSHETIQGGTVAVVLTDANDDEAWIDLHAVRSLINGLRDLEDNNTFTSVGDAEDVHLRPPLGGSGGCTVCGEWMQDNKPGLCFRDPQAGGVGPAGAVMCHVECGDALADALELVWENGDMGLADAV